MEKIKQYLKNNPNKIRDILKYYNYPMINIGKNEIRCAKIGGDNPSTIRIKLNDNLSAIDFSSNYSGDIIGLITHHNTDLSYKDVIDTIKVMTNKKLEGSHENKKGLFDNFFDDIYIPSEEIQDTTYDKSILDNYSKYRWNIRFLKDNINVKTQYDFNIGYDSISNRITLPWFNENGELIGIMGRLDSDEKTNYKYLPLISFPKRNYLYGLYENKMYLMGGREVYIFESEKSVLQCRSFGFYNAVALGGNSISTLQVEKLLQLNVERFIICLDEGLDTEIIKKDIQTIKSCCFMRDNVRIGFILDKENKYMPKDSKVSPSDLGKDIFEKLCEECMIGG